MFILGGPTPLAGEHGQRRRAGGSGRSPASEHLVWVRAAFYQARPVRPLRWPCVASLVRSAGRRRVSPAMSAGPLACPHAVMDQLTAVVGRPAMMPHWSLGWHQCKCAAAAGAAAAAAVTARPGGPLPPCCCPHTACLEHAHPCRPRSNAAPRRPGLPHQVRLRLGVGGGAGGGQLLGSGAAAGGHLDGCEGEGGGGEVCWWGEAPRGSKRPACDLLGTWTADGCGSMPDKCMQACRQA